MGAFAVSAVLARPSFFFTSRRRHTRCLSDWSSDVCSSDLATLTHWNNVKVFDYGRDHDGTFYYVRSEERRVGKECRSRWTQHHYRKEVLTRFCVALCDQLFVLPEHVAPPRSFACHRRQCHA